MIFQYYKETDMLYIKLSDGVSMESEEVSAGIVFDYNEDNTVIGIEIEDASKSIDLSNIEIKALPVFNFILNEKPAEAFSRK
jgi:uncharacterized protein YuzE